MLYVYPFDLYKFGLLLISANPSGIAELKLAEQLLDAGHSAESSAGPAGSLTAQEVETWRRKG